MGFPLVGKGFTGFTIGLSSVAGTALGKVKAKAPCARRCLVDIALLLDGIAAGVMLAILT